MSLTLNTTEYSGQNAYTLIQLANLSYASRADIKKKFSKLTKYERYHFLSRKGTQCIIASTASSIYIAFRGTQVNRIEDILSDIEVVPTRAYGGKVHHGFYKAYRRIRSKLLAKIKMHNSKETNKPIFICGHSLGGAIASIAAYDLTSLNYTVQGVYTAGQPRVGNQAFAESYAALVKDRTYRFANVEDIIPSIPPKKVPVFNYEYQHVGKKIYVVDEHTLTTKYEHSDNLFNRFEDAGSSLAAHSSKGYEEAVKNNINFDPFTESKLIKEKPLITARDVEKEVNKVIEEIDNFGKESGKKIAKLAKKWF